MGDIFLACKRGDFERVKFLVEEMLCDVNVTDKWDSTPLYYACLSGYEEIVHFLLQSGASVDDKFSGERCMNCALTETIRQMLRNPPEVKQTQSSSFRDAMGYMMTEAYQNYSDTCLVIGNQRLYVHRVVLCRQSIYFAHSLLGHNRGKDLLYFKHPKERSVLAWTQIMRYMYTQQLDIDATCYKDCLHLSRRLGLQQLTSQLREICVKLQKKSEDTHTIESECITYPELADIALSQGRKQRQYFADLCCVVGEQRFYCHKSFLVAQSPYFAALLNTDQFTEVTTSTKGNLTFVTLTNIRAEIFALILKFIYSGITDINADTLHALLFYSDHYMIHGLKVACGNLLAAQLDLANAIRTLSLARLIRMSRLQHATLRFLAYNFENVEDKSELMRMVVVDEMTNRGDRLVRISESSVDSMEDMELEEESVEEESVDLQLDLRMYLRERTNKLRHSPAAQLREERCVKVLTSMIYK